MWKYYVIETKNNLKPSAYRIFVYKHYKIYHIDFKLGKLISMALKTKQKSTNNN